MDICGHTEERARLSRIAALPFPPQSFLFAGPQHLGKFLVALEFSRKLTGTDIAADDRQSDLLVIGRPLETSAEDGLKRVAISVDDIRQAEIFLSRFPRAGRYRVVIIDEAERLTVSAENALLKILEEPNSTSVIILVTHRPSQLLPTVCSRLFSISFKPLSTETLRAFFPQADLPDFFFSLGLPGLVAEAFRDTDAFATQKELLRSLFRLSLLKWNERLALAEKLASRSDELPALLELWIVGLTRQRGSQAMQSAAFVSFLHAVLETLDKISLREGNPRLLLEKLFTKI